MTDEKIQKKIKALLDRANHEGTTEHEAALCQEKAEALMQQYRITMAMMDFDSNESGRKIVSEELDTNFEAHTGRLRSMMFSVYKHCGCQIGQKWTGTTAVGYEDDLFYAGMVWANIYLDFSRQLLQTWQANRTFDSNVYHLKESGKSWMEIVYASPASEGLNKNSGARLRAAYARYAESIGADKKAQPRNPKLWRESFAQSYSVRLGERLWDLRQKAEKENTTDEKGALALVRDEDRVKAEFYRLFPDLDPENVAKRMDEYRAAEEARRAGLSDKERAAEDRARERASRRIYRAPKTRNADMAGWNAGHKAASNVDLGGTKIGRNKKELG